MIKSIYYCLFLISIIMKIGNNYFSFYLTIYSSHGIFNLPQNLSTGLQQTLWETFVRVRP